MNYKRGSNAVQGNMLGAGIHLRMNYRLRVIIGQGVRRGEGFMPEVSWVPDKHKGGVSVLDEPFRTTFVFGINSSGYFLSVPGIIDRQPGGGNVDDRCARGWGRHTDSVSVFVTFF